MRCPLIDEVDMPTDAACKGRVVMPIFRWNSQANGCASEEISVQWSKDIAWWWRRKSAKRSQWDKLDIGKADFVVF